MRASSPAKKSSWMANTNCNPARRSRPASPPKARKAKGQSLRLIESMNVSEPFIHRPIATSLLMAGVVLMGLLGYVLLPVSALPPVDFPTIQVTGQFPGAGPEVMVSSEIGRAHV